MQPLDTLFGPLLARVNRTLAETTPARELARDLENREFAVRISRSALAICLAVEDGRLVRRDVAAETPDVIVEGPLSGLVQLALAEGDMAALGDSGVTITGRADLAQKFERLLKLSRPDPEEELAGIIGDAAAHRVGETVRRLADWGRRSGSIMAANVREYLQEESRELPSRYEMDRFERDVQTLRDDVERTEARLRRLERKRA